MVLPFRLLSLFSIDWLLLLLETPGVPVGVLTAEERDKWADLRGKLEESNVNRATLRLFLSLIFLSFLSDDHFFSLAIFLDLI
jgi:hypothetical protein